MRNLSRMMVGLLLGTAMLIPTVAQAQEQGRDRGDRGAGRSFDGSRGEGRGREMRGGDPAAREAMARGREAARDIERPAPAAPVEARRSDDSRRQWPGGNRDWNRGGGETRRDVIARGRNDGDGLWDAGRRADDNRRPQIDRDRNRDDGNRHWSTDRRDWGNDGRADGRRDGRADRHDGRTWDRNWTSDRHRWDDRDNRGWDRNWRNDRRYSWQDYRNRNRQTYHLPRYNPPRWGHSYRRWSPGFQWDRWYYSSNYWITDPWQYRLPPAYGDYRWVRYYDDAVLVDIRTGEIIDIIYTFFF